MLERRGRAGRPPHRRERHWAEKDLCGTRPSSRRASTSRRRFDSEPAFILNLGQTGKRSILTPPRLPDQASYTHWSVFDLKAKPTLHCAQPTSADHRHLRHRLRSLSNGATRSCKRAPYTPHHAGSGRSSTNTRSASCTPRPPHPHNDEVGANLRPSTTFVAGISAASAADHPELDVVPRAVATTCPCRGHLWQTETGGMMISRCPAYRTKPARR